MSSQTMFANGEVHQINALGYNSSKTAVNSLTLAFGTEFGTDGPEILGVTPGFTTTDLNNNTPGGKTSSVSAKMNHLTISQLRYYDDQGLLPFLQRTEKGDRVFDEEALKYLEMILCLKNTGMPINRIKQFIDWSMIGVETIPQRLEMMRQQEANVLQQIRDTEENLKKIQQKIEKYQSEML